MFLTKLVPRTLYSTDTSNWILSQAQICSLRHTFKPTYILYHQFYCFCSSTRRAQPVTSFVSSFPCTAYSRLSNDSIPFLYFPSHNLSLTSLSFPPKTFGHKKVRDETSHCYSFLIQLFRLIAMWTLYSVYLFFSPSSSHSERITFSLGITNSTFSLTMTNSSESIWNTQLYSVHDRV